MTKATTGGSVWKDWAVAMLCLAAVLGFLFRQSLNPDMVLFSNDAPLGLISSNAGVAASTFDGIVTGFWQDLNWIGIEMPSVLPGLSWGMFQLFGASPVANAKLHVPTSFLFLGFSAWLLFRTLGFRQVVCVIGALAAALNMNSFSHGAWGLPSRALTWGSALLAIAALYSGAARRPWIKAALAGMCVGMGIVEGFDVGALYSLYIAAFGIFLALQKPKKEMPKGIIAVAVVAICAGLFSAQALSTLIGTQVKGVAGMQQDAATKEKHWDEATAWSLPKMETLRVIVPGLFGYRMDTPEGGNYWGSVGYPAYQRHSGAGEYAGVIVVLIAALAVGNSFRKAAPIFSDFERRAVKFWACAALISILFAWGRWAPFYQLIYHLPFFSTIRNPIKFMHFFHLSLLILFGYGLQTIFRHYLAAAMRATGSPKEQFKAWWAKAAFVDRRIVMGFGVGLVISLLAVMRYSAATKEIVSYLNTVGFQGRIAEQIAAFSISEAGVYLIVYAISLAAVLLCLCGFFAGDRARWAGMAIGGLLVVDMARANSPWIIYYNYKERYASNAVIDFLRQNPVDHRVTMFTSPFYSAPLADERSQQAQIMMALANEWLQNQFQFYNVQACDIIQFPRRPELDETFRTEFSPQNGLPSCARFWQLSSTKWMIGQRGFEAELNKSFDPMGHRFTILTNFNLRPKPGVQQATSVNDLEWFLDPNGPFSIFQFDGALPRGSLFTRWKSMSDDSLALKRLNSPTFDPTQEALVNEASVAASDNTSTNAGRVQVVGYAPKKIQLKADAAAPSILVWNDRWSPNWTAYLDGKQVPLLRCNYIMRGVQVPAGSHTVEMRYAQPAKMLWVSFATLAVGVAFCFFLAFDSRRKSDA